MKQYKVYYKNEYRGLTVVSSEIYIGYRFRTKELDNTINQDYYSHNLPDTDIEYVITTIKDDKIWVHRYDNWLRRERNKKINELLNIKS